MYTNKQHLNTHNNQLYIQTMSGLNNLLKDLENMLGWQLPYILSNPEARKWYKAMKEAGPDTLPHIAKLVASLETEELETIALRAAVKKLLEKYERENHD
jgi:hypothetical protein